MASGKKPRSAPDWRVMLQRIESQYRMVIEAIEANRAHMEHRCRDLETSLGGRLDTLANEVNAAGLSTKLS